MSSERDAAHMGAGDPIQPEVMPTNGAALAVHDEPTEAERAAVAAIEAAATHALDIPAIASRDEFLSLCLQARIMANSELAPRALRGKPYDVLMVLMTARELNIGATAAMRKVYVIDGQPSLAPQLECALIRQRGLGSVVPHPDNSAVEAWAVPVGPDGKIMGDPVSYDWNDALDGELVDPTCTPDWENKRVVHNIRDITKKGKGGSTYKVRGCGCKDNYRKNGRDMLYWRAVGRCCRYYFPEVGLGLYSPDELGALTDEGGEPLDPMNVELPAGFENPPLEPKQRAVGQGAEDPADPEDVLALQVRVKALPEPMVEVLRSAWTDAQLPHPTKLWRSQLRKAKALVTGIESGARKEFPDWDGASVAEDVVSVIGFLTALSHSPFTVGRQEPPEAPPAPEPTPEPEAAAQEAPGAESEDTAPAGEPGGEPEKPEVVNPEDDPKTVARALKHDIDGVPGDVLGDVAKMVKEMHHTKVNSELARLGGPTSGHIDVRRMRLTGKLAKPTWLGRQHEAGEHDSGGAVRGCPGCEEAF